MQGALRPVWMGPKWLPLSCECILYRSHWKSLGKIFLVEVPELALSSHGCENRTRDSFLTCSLSCAFATFSVFNNVCRRSLDFVLCRCHCIMYALLVFSAVHCRLQSGRLEYIFWKKKEDCWKLKNVLAVCHHARYKLQAKWRIFSSFFRGCHS